jgi:hypothetical protein
LVEGKWKGGRALDNSKMIAAPNREWAKGEKDIAQKRGRPKREI